jgi:hypothetical protein
MKLFQWLIQPAAIVFLIWMAVHDASRSGFISLIPFGVIGVIFLAQWWIENKFPQASARCNAFKILVWVLISLALLLTILSFISFDASTSQAFSLTLNFTFILLVLAYMQQQKLTRKLIEEQTKDDPTIQRFTI